MKKRILSLALALTIALSCAPFAGAVKTEFTGMSSDCAKAYLNIVDQQIKKYGGYTITQSYPMYPGFAGGFVRDFDQNGTPELYLISFESAQNAYEQIWTWDGKRAKLLYEDDVSCLNYHSSDSSAIHVLNGKTYFHASNSAGGMGYYEGTGAVYSVQGTSWKTEISYRYENSDGVAPGFGPQENVFYTEKNGTRTNYSSEDALWAAIGKYESTDSIELFIPGAGCVTVGFEPNGLSLRNQLLYLASTPPSDIPFTDVLSTLSTKERKELFDTKLFSFTGGDEIDFRTASEKELLEAIHAVHYTPDCTYQFKYDRDIASYNGKYLNYKGISKTNLDQATLELFGRTINLSPYQQKVEPDRWDWDSWSVAHQNALYFRDDYWVRTFSGSIDVTPEHLYDLGNGFYCAVHREYWDGEYWDWDLNQMVDNDDDDSAMVYYSIVKKNSDGTWRLVHLFPNTYVPTVAELTALVGPSSWAKAEVEAADAAGLIPDLTGDPGWQDTSTRLQFCQLAVQLAETALGETLPAAPVNTFTDCSDLAVRKAYATGIVNGMTETTFSPNGTLTREQLATMLWRAVNYIQTQSGEQALTGGGSLTGYTDAGSVSGYAKEAVAALNKNGIMKGTSNTALSPKGSCTVEQSVLLSYRTFLKF